MVLMNRNVDEYRGVLELPHELGCDFMAEPTVRPRGDGRDDVVDEHRVPAHRLADFYADEEVEAGCLEGTIVRSAEAPGRASVHNCTAGLTYAYVRSNGDVLACVGLGDPFGNILRAPFREVWRGSAAERHRRRMRAPLRECPECAVSPYCTQRCPRLALVENGDLSGPSERACGIARLLYDLHTRRHGVAPRGA